MRQPSQGYGGRPRRVPMSGTATHRGALLKPYQTICGAAATEAALGPDVFVGHRTGREFMSAHPPPYAPRSEAVDVNADRSRPRSGRGRSRLPVDEQV
jgi:hypothetical protein